MFKVNLGVQSYCFRGFKDNIKVADMVRECGLSAIELCGVHVDFSNPSLFKEVIGIYRDRGIAIPAIGVNFFKGDEGAERKSFEFAAAAGAKVIGGTFGIDSVPGSYRTVEKLADEFDINLAIHNHGGRDWMGCATTLRHVFTSTSPRIGLCLDTAWALDSGEDPLAMAEMFRDRLYSLHIKDFVFDRARKPQDVIAGEGNLKLAKLLGILKKNGFAGCSIIEYEGDVDNPVPAITRSAAAVRQAESAC